MKNHCCHLPHPAGPFALSLEEDSSLFATYVGGGIPARPSLRNAKHLTSALHFEMKLWQPGQGSLPTPPYKINDAQHNSWQAMRQKSTNTFSSKEQTAIFNAFPPSFPTRMDCALFSYDRWILGNIVSLRRKGLAQPGSFGTAGPGLPTTLASIGKAQKLVNIYIKYILCWQIAGQWQQSLNSFHVFKPPFVPNNFLCALHAPIDRILINHLLKLPVGRYLQRAGVLRAGEIQQSSDGDWKPWSKLDCLRTYYGLQLVFRRIAMASWPDECSCATPIALTTECKDMFEKEFGNDQKFTGPDWLQIALNIPPAVIAESLGSLPQFVDAGGKLQESPVPVLKPAYDVNESRETGTQQRAGAPDRVRALAEMIFRESESDLVPGAPTLGKSTPVRIVRPGKECTLWQYHIQQKSIRIDVFFPPGKTGNYDAVRRRAGISGHDFGEGIKGNGDKGGNSRSISISVDGGASSPAAEWPAIAQAAIAAMDQLYARINPLL